MIDQRPSSLSPHIFVRHVDQAVRFYQEAFRATEVFRNTLPDGRVLFVELAFGDNRVLISEEFPSLGALAPPTVGGSPVLLHLEVGDVEGVFQAAISAGAEVEMPLQEMFWGERYGIVRDPAGHRWSIATDRGQLSPHEMQEGTPPEV